MKRAKPRARLPVFASKAKTWPASADMNITPSITNGIALICGSSMSNCLIRADVPLLQV
jgi:hypothetical protein